jgi:hypothetical protein
MTEATAITIERCKALDLHEVMSFIDEHWSRGHVLAHDRELMMWQHGDPADTEHLNWLLARKGSEILGIIGYIPMRIYRTSLEKGQRVVWVALWKVRPEGGTGLGLRLLNSISRFEPCDAIGVLGLNPTHPPMYRALGFNTGELNHWIAVNSRVTTFSILGVPSGWHPPVPKAGETKLVPWSKFDSRAWARLNEGGLGWLNRGIKSSQFFESRYVRHPRYDYDVFALVLQDELKGLLATRVASASAGCILRLVDFMGDERAFAELGTALGERMLTVNAEYLDLWESGFSPETLSRLGLVLVRDVDGLVAPNYFEPFLAKNGRIEFAMKGFSNLPYLVMRGDGDQDRPNRLIQKDIYAN